jgi:hypothetical protein
VADLQHHPGEGWDIVGYVREDKPGDQGTCFLDLTGDAKDWTAILA